MEVLQALVLKANLDAGTAEPSPVLAQVFGNIPEMAGFVCVSVESVILKSVTMWNILGKECLHRKPGGGSQARGGEDATGGGRGSWQGGGEPPLS